ncbi:MAG: glycosyltransferase family 4 protein [Chthoniobacterales bacterium]
MNGKDLNLTEMKEITSRRLSLLILCYEYPPLGGGGGRVAAQVASALSQRGHNVRVVTGGMSHLPKQSIIDGIEVRRVNSGRRREDTCSVFEMLLWVLIALPVTLKVVEKQKLDIIHAHFAVPTGLVAWLVHLLTGIPYVLTAHLGDVPGGVPEQTGLLFKIVKPLTVPLWKRAASVTAVSSFVANLAKKAYGIDPQVILNGINLPEKMVEKNSTTPQLLMVGRLSIQKNSLLAIQALARLRELSWNLKIIGDGPLRSSLQKEIDRENLSDRVKLMGWASGSEVEAAMQEADILLMPSLSEGLPMVGVEALAHGLAIVGSDIGGLHDVVENKKNGQLFNLAGGADAMAGALRPFLEDSKLLKKAQQASLSKAKAFELSHSIDQYEEVFGYRKIPYN